MRSTRGSTPTGSSSPIQMETGASRAQMPPSSWPCPASPSRTSSRSVNRLPMPRDAIAKCGPPLPIHAATKAGAEVVMEVVIKLRNIQHKGVADLVTDDSLQRQPLAVALLLIHDPLLMLPSFSLVASSSSSPSAVATKPAPKAPQQQRGLLRSTSSWPLSVLCSTWSSYVG
ncbi:hypothetical protein ACQJBY_002930 [Aegilops geniculata]